MTAALLILSGKSKISKIKEEGIWQAVDEDRAQADQEKPPPKKHSKAIQAAAR